MWRTISALFRTYLKSTLEYRWELVLWAVLTLVPLGLIFIIWAGVFRDQASAQGYDLSSIIQYYLLVAVIDETTSSHFESWRVVQIREGKIDLFMTRPISYLLDVLIGDIAGKFVYLIVTFPLYIVAIVGLSAIGLLASITIAPLVALQFTFLLIAGFAIEFLFALMIVILGFWFEGSEGLEHFKWVAIGTLSGWMIPLAFMPSWLRNFVELLPFKYMYALPIGLIQRTAQLHMSDILYQASFIGCLLLLVMWLWSRARKKYGGYGG